MKTWNNQIFHRWTLTVLKVQSPSRHIHQWYSNPNPKFFFSNTRTRSVPKLKTSTRWSLIGRATSFTAQSFLHTAHTVYVYCRYLQYSASDIILTDIWPPYLHPPQQITNLWHKSWVHSAGRSVMGVSILSLTGQSDGAKTGPTITRTYLSK